MIVALGIALWLLVGVATVTYVIYTDADAFEDTCRRGQVDSFLATLAALAGPAALAYVAVQRTFRTANRARVNKEKLRRELEKELAAAKKEIDDMLKRGVL